MKTRHIQFLTSITNCNNIITNCNMIKNRLPRTAASLRLAAGLLTAALALATAQSSAPGQNPKPKDDPNKPKQLATLKGKVANAVTNDALKKTTLILTRSSGSGATTKAETGDKGEFSFEDIEPGRYYLFAERTGFTRQAYGARGNALIGTGLLFSAGQEIKDVLFKLQPNSVISGKVLDEDGEPIPQTMVMALRVMYQRGKKQFLPLATSITNDLGEYRLANLKGGKYSVSATPMNIGIGVAGTSSKPPDRKSVV